MTDEFHVGCGIFGIYAGRVHTYKDGHQEFRGEKHEVTEDCIHSVIAYLLSKNNESDVYCLKDGREVQLKLVEVKK